VNEPVGWTTVSSGIRAEIINKEVQMPRFKHEAFIKHMEHFVEELDDEKFNRAWEIVLACIEVHARIDREPKESKLKSTSRAWADFALAAQGELATPTMVGMLEELVSMCPSINQWDGTLDQHISEAIALGRGNPGFVRWGRPVRKEPLLYLIEGRREELGEPMF
jgi:hypothetical protein